MFSIDKEKFGAFVAQLRKEKGLMQKDLAERLYVSDKAVSKWERGLSIPDVALLVPLAEILDVTVTELLESRRIPQAEPMDSRQTEELVQKVIDMTSEKPGGRAGRGLQLLACTAAGGLELWLLIRVGIPWEEIAVSLGTVMMLMVLFGFYFCLFAREKLPRYYDENRISSYSEGVVRINLPGVYFNNRNWPHILRAIQRWALVGLVASPALFFLLRTLLPKVWDAASVYIILVLTLGGLFIPMMVVARKYEFAPEQPRPRGKDWQQFGWIAVILIVVAALIGSVGSGSGLQVGWSEQKGLNSWSASYAYYDGWQQRTVNWNGDAETLYVEVCTQSGELDLTVTDGEGNDVFTRKDVGTGGFTIPLPGKAAVRITAEGHKGSISLNWQ